ncbi:hypothetical protein [Propioniciclava flava]
MTTLIAVLPGALIALGLVICVMAFRPQHARLADALSALEVRPAAATTTEPGRPGSRRRLVDARAACSR